MILLCPVASGQLLLEQSMFISTEMGQTLSREISQGRLQLNQRLVPVHLPYEGLLTMDYGEHNHLKVEMNQWFSMGLPPQYHGEDLSGKRLIVFPMHGLGDQLYLSVALRSLEAKYPGMKTIIVKPSIASSEQWYPLIYFEPFYEITGPVVKPDEMRSYDYYLNAEHFAHVPEYNGTYPPEFYMRHFFHHVEHVILEPVPRIAPDSVKDTPNGAVVSRVVQGLKQRGKPLVFVNSVSTGRVRDLSLNTLIEFIKLSEERFSFLVSSFKRPDIQEAVSSMNLPHVLSTEGLINHVRDLCLIIISSDFIITTDSGITHLAEALSVPCGSVFNVVSPEERTKPYRFSESLKVDFKLEGICETPCYVHALKDGNLCPGMAYINDEENQRLFYDYPPCVTHLEGEHLVLLLDALYETFGWKGGKDIHG
jgi:hypothetical protein